MTHVTSRVICYRLGDTTTSADAGVVSLGHCSLKEPIPFQAAFELFFF